MNIELILKLPHRFGVVDALLLSGRSSNATANVKHKYECELNRLVKEGKLIKVSKVKYKYASKEAYDTMFDLKINSPVLWDSHKVIKKPYGQYILHNGLSVAELADLLGVSRQQASNNIHKLLKYGLVKQIGGYRYAAI